MEKINYELESQKTNRIIRFEWISTIAVFIICFVWLSYKIEKQADRTDKFYEMLIDLLKEKKGDK